MAKKGKRALTRPVDAPRAAAPARAGWAATVLAAALVVTGVVVALHRVLPASRAYAPYIALLGTPHYFYVAVWTNGPNWVASVKAWRGAAADPSATMAVVAQAMKALQVATVVAFLANAGALSDAGEAAFDVSQLSLRYLRVELSKMSSARMLLGTAAVALGQTLNAAMMKAIGVRGVYYGCKFGYTVPWCSGFPFNIPGMRHPQYVGALLTLIGGGALLYNERTAAAGLDILVAAWCVFYVALGFVEDNY